MKKKIIVVDYIGNSNEEGIPIGHPIKVVDEYINLINKDLFDTKVICPSNYEGIMNNKIDKTLDYYINLSSNKKINDKIKDFIKKYKNIKKSVQEADKEDIIWFINVDFVLFVYLTLSNKKKLNNTMLNLYMYKYSFGSFKTIKNYFIEKSVKKAKLILKTNPRLKFPTNSEVIYIPDYYYRRDQYDKYIKPDKKEEVVCLGTMNNDKMIEEVIDIFKDKNIKVKIMGHFFDKERYMKIKNNISSNIILEDRYIEKDEYYRIMGESKYAILPYREDVYMERTSGVLIESMFLNTIPIGNEKILKFNNVKGIGYSKISDLKSVDLSDSDVSTILEKNRKIVFENYDYKKLFKDLNETIYKIFKLKDGDK